uniref:Uncharacterized protein n=1 Tax=Cynoglossus semilaevis TaxID=244447 RepID=A0A3P8V245_CYNSE
IWKRDRKKGKEGGRLRCLRGGFLAFSPLISLAGLKRAARLLLCRLAWTPSRLGRVLFCRGLGWARGDPCLFPGGSAPVPGVMMPVHLLICFWRYFRWFTFLLDFTGLSRASLMLLEAESMKFSRSRVSEQPSLCSRSSAASPAVIPEPKLSSKHVSVCARGKHSLPDTASCKHSRLKVTGCEQSREILQGAGQMMSEHQRGGAQGPGDLTLCLCPTTCI